jgi:uncharacterized protein (TIRG00374 family)
MTGWKKHLGWIISAAFLILAFRQVAWTEFTRSILKVAWWEPLMIVAIYLIGYSVRGLRSYILLPGLSFGQALGGVFVGYATNNVLPARLGEVVRAHVVGKAAGIKRSVALSSVLVERIFDGCAIVVLLLVGAADLDLPEWALQARWWGIALFSVAFAGVLLVGWTSAFWERLLPEHSVAELVRGLLRGIALAVRSVPVLLLVATSSLGIWLIEGVMFLACASALQIEISLRGALFVMSIVNLGVLIPSSPGGLGLFQYFCIISLQFLGATKADASAYSVLLHACQYLPITVIGLVWLRQLGEQLPTTSATSGGSRAEDALERLGAA